MVGWNCEVKRRNARRWTSLAKREARKGNDARRECAKHANTRALVGRSNELQQVASIRMHTKYANEHFNICLSQWRFLIINLVYVARCKQPIWSLRMNHCNSLTTQLSNFIALSLSVSNNIAQSISSNPNKTRLITWNERKSTLSLINANNVAAYVHLGVGRMP